MGIADVKMMVIIVLIPFINLYKYIKTYISIKYIYIILFYFSVREQAVFYKSCNQIGSESGQYSPHPAR